MRPKLTTLLTTVFIIATAFTPITKASAGESAISSCQNICRDIQVSAYENQSVNPNSLYFWYWYIIYFKPLPNQTVDSTTDTAKTTTYTYDDLNRLLTAVVTNAANGSNTTKTYTYSAIGNILTGDPGTYTYAGTNYANPHAVTSIGSTNYSYDNNGNLTGDGTWTNTWNYKNTPTQSSKTGVTVTYAYDHTGQRVKLSNGTTTTRYPSKFYNTDGTTPTKHIFDNAGNVVATVQGTGASSTIYFDHTDHLTGSNAITDTTGGLMQLLDYHPYGSFRIDWKFGSFDEQRKFTGHEYDRDTSLTYANARYYNQGIGRFYGQDPVFIGTTFNLSDPQSLNSYSYSRNNPLRYIDQDGEAWRDYVNNARGYAVGQALGAYGFARGTVGAAFNPIQTLNGASSLLSGGIRSGISLGQDLATNPSQVWSEISSGYGLHYNEFASLSPYEQGKAVGNLFGQVEASIPTGAVASKVASSVGAQTKVLKITEAYKRPSGATNQVLRDSVQGKTCVNCGTAGKMYADHKIPLVKEYYQTGKIDLKKMLDPKSIQPQCANCSNIQGGILSNFAKQMKSKLGL